MLPCCLIYIDITLQTNLLLKNVQKNFFLSIKSNTVFSLVILLKNINKSILFESLINSTHKVQIVVKRININKILLKYNKYVFKL